MLSVALTSTLVLASASHAQDPAPAQLDEVVVTGALTRGAPPGGVLRLGQTALQDPDLVDPARLITRLVVNSGSEHQVDQLNQPQSSGTAQFNLRGLGFGSTLVLIDGQRQTASAVISSDGSSFTDINALTPRIAIARVEVSRDGGSALYGSDAVAGVVNFITRTSGTPEIRATHAIAEGGSESLVEGFGGLGLWGGDLSAAASVFHRDPIGSDDRSWTQARSYGRPAWSAVTSYGQPGSYYIPGRNAFAPDPDCDNPAFTHAFRNTPTDAFCRLDYSDFFDLAPEEDRTQLWSAWSGGLDGVTIRLQAGWTGSTTVVRQSPSLPILALSPVVPADHPANSFGETALFRGRLLGAEAGASTARFEYDTRRGALDLGGDISDAWRWRASATVSRQTVFYDKPDVIGSRLAAALAGQGGADCAASPAACRVFNPFASAVLGTGPANDPALVTWLTGTTGLRGAASLAAGELVMTGSLGEAAGVPLQAAFGLAARKARMRHDWSDLVNAGELLTAGLSPDVSGSQNALAAFAELRWTGRRLDLQGAWRAERYDAGFGRLNPSLQIGWTASDRLDIVLGYAEAFKAPSVFALAGAQAAQPSVFDRGAFVFVNTLARGDPDLRPERARSFSAALGWRPLEDLTFEVRGWRHALDDVVVKETAQAIIDAARKDDEAGLSGTAPSRGSPAI